jgi:hypothetical protein
MHLLHRLHRMPALSVSVFYALESLGEAQIVQENLRMPINHNAADQSCGADFAVATRRSTQVGLRSCYGGAQPAGTRPITLLKSASGGAMKQKYLWGGGSFHMTILWAVTYMWPRSSSPRSFDSRSSASDDCAANPISTLAGKWQSGGAAPNDRRGSSSSSHPARLNSQAMAMTGLKPGRLIDPP